MGNVRMRADQINYGATNVKVALDDLDPKDLIALSKRMDKIEAWQDTVEETTVSGAEAVFTNALALPAVSLITSIEAIQDLHGYDKPWVGGANYNQWDEVWELGGISGTDGTNISANDRIRSKNYIPVNAGSEYYFTCEASSTGEPYFYVCLYDSSKTFIERVQRNNHTSYTIPAGVSYIRFFVYSDTVQITTYNNDIAINYPATVTTYSPYSNICPISGRTAVAVDDTGRNIWDEEWEQGAYSYASTGAKNSAPNYIRNKNLIPVSPNTEYYLKKPSSGDVRCGFYDANGGYLSSSISISGTGAVFTTPNNCYNITFDYTVATTYNHDICINISDASFNGQYAPYQHSSVTIQLGQTVYGGSLNVTTGVMTVDRALYTISSEDAWTAITTNVYQYTTRLNGAATGETTFTDAISSCFNEQQTGMSSMTNGGFKIQDGYLYVKSTDYDTASDFLTAFAGQTVCYELATPQTIQLTPTQLQMLKGYNRLSSDGGDIEVTAYTGAAWGGDEA